MKTKDYVKKSWFFCSFAILTALFLVVSPYLSEGTVVEVDDVEELYAQVNNPNNAGTTINLLAAGSPYLLTPNDPNGLSRPNGGSLFLQPGMTLIGENVYHFNSDGDEVPDARDDNGDGIPDLDLEDREIYADPQTETIIDGTALNVPVPGAGVVSGAIVVRGPVEVSISNVTVIGGPLTQAEIEIRAPENSTSNVTVRECILEKGRRGIYVDASPRWRIPGTLPVDYKNAMVNLLAERSVIRNNIVPGVLNGWGIHTGQGNTSGAKFSVNVRHNRFCQNKVGLLIENAGTDVGVTEVVSQSNVYEEAVLTPDPRFIHVISAGIFIFVSDSVTLPRRSLGNRIHLISNHDAIWNNEGWAGLYVRGIWRISNGTEIKDNEIDIELLGTRFVKLNEDGEFVGDQNREARVDVDLGKTVEDQPILRRDVVVVGAHTSKTNHREPPPDGDLTGPASGNSVNLLVRKSMSSLMPTSYDLAPETIFIDDNAPEEVDITVIGSSNAFERTNTGFNLPDESLFESE